MDKRTWWATVHGVAKNRIQLSWVIFHCIHAIEHNLSNITVIKVYPQATNAKEAEVELFYEDQQDLLALTQKKNVLFIIGDWNGKLVSQVLTWVTGKFGLGIQNEAGKRLTEFCQENTLVIANTLFQQHKRRLCTWTSPNGQYQNKIDYILCSQR